MVKIDIENNGKKGRFAIYEDDIETAQKRKLQSSKLRVTTIALSIGTAYRGNCYKQKIRVMYLNLIFSKPRC